MLPVHVNRVINLDSDLVVVDDITELWEFDLEAKVLVAPEYCHASFTKYFTSLFWSDLNLSQTSEGKEPLVLQHWGDDTGHRPV